MHISVVIPTFNAGEQISALLDALKRQQQQPFEIIVIDSGSTDDTRARVESSGARFVELKEKFNHGLARDAGIAETTAELIFLTVQDALPEREDCLARFARHFDDLKVAGVSSRQVPPPNGPAELKIKAELDARENEPVQKISLADHPDYATYSPAERVALYRFDNVGAMLRRSVWEKLHFGACDYAEDLLWAQRALEAGHTIVRDFTAPIVHAHRRTFGYEFRRGLLDARVMDELFGFRYRFFKKLNRVRMLAAPKMPGRSGALKTYSAHALSRMIYPLLKPFGKGALDRWTKGI